MNPTTQGMQPTLPEPAQPTVPQPIAQPNPQPQPIYLQRPPQPPRHHRLSTSCDRHPQEHFSGVCPSCLRERLTILDSNPSFSSSARNPTTFFSVGPSLNASFRSFISNSQGNRSATSTFFSMFRRTMSLSDSRKERFFSLFKRKRKSCDVRVRRTLSSLFNKEDECKILQKEEAKTQNADSSSTVQRPLNEQDGHQERENVVLPVGIEEDEENDDEIRVVEEPSNMTVTSSVIIQRSHQEIIEELENEIATMMGNIDKEKEMLEPMEEHINLDPNAKKGFRRSFKEITRSFWSATLTLNKKMQKWRHNKMM